MKKRFIGENQLFLRFIEFLKNLSEFEPEQKTFRIVSIKFGEQNNILRVRDWRRNNIVV